MNGADVYALIRYAMSLDPRVGRRDDEEMALAVMSWHAELPTALTRQRAMMIIHDLHRNGELPTPAAIGRVWDEQHTPKHQQGLTRSPRPITADRAAPALPSPPAPVRVILDGPATTAALDRLDIRRHPLPPSVACPWCGAAPRQHCTQPNGEPLTGNASHPSRHDAAAGLDVSRVQRRAENPPAAPPARVGKKTP